MKRLFTLLMALLIAALAGCASGDSSDAVEAEAREVMTADGYADAEIMQIVEGDPAVRGADELYCVATDATSPSGDLPYLLVVWRAGSTWEGAQLVEGYYDWDLQGCPR